MHNNYNMYMWYYYEFYLQCVADNKQRMAKLEKQKEESRKKARIEHKKTPFNGSIKTVYY